MTLTVLSRTYCHLCDDLIAALENFRCSRSVKWPFEIKIVDIDQYADLEALYGDKVPVLLDGDVEICHYFLNEDALAVHLHLTCRN